MDYYTQSATLIPCSLEQAEALANLSNADEVTAILGEDVANAIRNKTYVVESEPVTPLAIIAAVINNLMPMADNEFDEVLDLLGALDLEADENGLLVGSDASSLETISELAYEVLKACKRTDVIEVAVAYSASRPALDTFGGDSAIVSAKHLIYLGAGAVGRDTVIDAVENNKVFWLRTSGGDAQIKIITDGTHAGEGYVEISALAYHNLKGVVAVMD